MAGIAQESDVELSVSDTGPSIAPEHLPHVFDRFYREDKARSRAEGGVGLGLSISGWIAEAHGGTMSVESTPGQGAVFTITLPRIAPQTRPVGSTAFHLSFIAASSGGVSLTLKA